MKLIYKIGLITIYVLIFETIESNSYELSLCNARKNTYWKERKQECVPCRSCPAGEARNLSMEIKIKTGPNGDEECLPCQECPDDHYVHIQKLDGIPPYCSPCSSDCLSMFRYVKNKCSSLNDWQCGDCLPGYDNSYTNSDFPCTKKEANKPTTGTSTPVTTPVNITALVGPSRHGKENGGGFASLPAPLQVVIIVIAVVVSFALIAISVAFACTRLCPRKSASTETLSTKYSSLSTIEIDGGGNNSDGKLRTGPSHGPSDIPFTKPRGELSNPNSLPPEQLALLSAALNNCIKQTTGNFNRVCRCPFLKVDDCQECRPLLEKTNRKIGENTDLISFIVSEACHDPLQLFWSIGVKDSHIYHFNDDRNRNPEKISQQDFIYNVLNRWLQVNNEATYHNLFKGVCVGGFHHINSAVYAKYDFFIPQV